MSIEAGVYTHFKGTQYFVHGVGRHTETGEEVVVYESLDQDPADKIFIWVRPLAMFLEEVEHNGEKVARFKFAALA